VRGSRRCAEGGNHAARNPQSNPPLPLQVLPSWKVSLSGSVSLRFRTNEKNGLLLFNPGRGKERVSFVLPGKDGHRATRWPAEERTLAAATTCEPLSIAVAKKLSFRPRKREKG